jgi:hypothetical protein
LLLVIAILAIVIAIVLVGTLEDVLIEGNPFSYTFLGTTLNALVELTENVTSTAWAWVYAGIFILMVFESSSLPIPSEIINPSLATSSPRACSTSGLSS